MSDTSPEVANLFRDMIMERSGEERVRMGADMFEASREIVLASLKAESPDDLRVRLFVRFYGADFEPAELARIVEAIRRHDSLTLPSAPTVK
ncbi:MAG TPA: hypothetical protein VE404_03930 [Verrucomicrobiae bacterium]|nr:hypothetical protein [Verrucomicrobiae bacterium]